MTRLGDMAIPSGVNVVHGNTGCGRGVEVAHQQATLLPVNLDVRGLPVTVVGGGGAALRRVAALREARADVTVVAAHVVPAIEDLADRGRLHWVRRDFRADDLGPACLVMVTTGRPDQDAAVATRPVPGTCCALLYDVIGAPRDILRFGADPRPTPRWKGCSRQPTPALRSGTPNPGALSSSGTGDPERAALVADPATRTATEVFPRTCHSCPRRRVDIGGFG